MSESNKENIDKEELIKLPVERVLKILKTDVNFGLSSEDVRERQRKYGFNDIPEEKKNPFITFGKKFWGPSAWILEIAAVLSYILGRMLDFYLIISLIILNAIISWAQEQKANKALELLKNKLQVQARALRDKKWNLVVARELVPGDIVRVRGGDFVPADIKIITGEAEVDQSALTGESLPAYKQVNDVIYSGSIVRRGEITGVVILTGVQTYFGKTVELVKIAKPRLRIEKVISKVVTWMVLLTGSLLGLAIIVTILRGENLLALLPLFLVLIVASIPIALPAMFSISLALGSKELSDVGVLVTKLDAIEGGATMDVLVTDKTGTITQNKLTIGKIITLNNNEDEVILYGSLASQEANQDPIDIAFIEEAKKRNLNISEYIQQSFKPFDPSTRRTEAIIIHNKDEFKVTKGALDVIAKLCNMNDQDIASLNVKIEELAQVGYRILAVAYDNGSGWKMAGLVGLRDPPRTDSPILIKELKELSVQIKMLTGDALPIAKQIAKDIGIGERIIKVADIKGIAQQDILKAAKLAEESDGFAETYPEDKYIIVKALQGSGHIVGMTGDGVNDAPALRQADVGIAVSNATDVAKGAAGVVLTQPGLRNMVDLIKIGRRIYERISTWILSRLTRTFQDVIFVTLALILTGHYVISALGMILLLFLFDFVTLTLSTDNVRWSKKPATWNVINLIKISIILGIFMVIESFIMLHIALTYLGLTEEKLMTFGFLYILYNNIFNLLNIRERRNFWVSRPSKPMLIAMTSDMIFAAIISIIGLPGLYPISLTLVLIVLIYTFIFYLIINNFIKVTVAKFLGLSW
jgi:H+-transporting ATPase